MDTFKPITTQEELDEIVKARLKREKRNAVKDLIVKLITFLDDYYRSLN